MNLYDLIAAFLATLAGVVSVGLGIWIGHERTEEPMPQRRQRYTTRIREHGDGFSMFVALDSDPSIYEETYGHKTKQAAEIAAALFISEFDVCERLSFEDVTP